MSQAKSLKIIDMKKQDLHIVKIGGKLMENEARLTSFLHDFAALKEPKILVHGGGNMATEIAAKLGFATQMIDGRRITDADSLKVIVMTYGGLINKTIVANLQALGTNAIGLCGADGNSIISKRREVKEIDYGFVGDVEEVNPKFITSLLGQGMIPVFSAISCTRDGVLLNTNADSIASEIANAMTKKFEVKLYFCMEKKGVMLNLDDEASVIKNLNPEKYRALIDEGRISNGMLPKLHNCFQAIANGVSAVYLGDASIINGETTGTMITQ